VPTGALRLVSILMLVAELVRTAARFRILKE
jgi:hypothetical protein